MIDETVLADPTRCPDCAAPLTPARDVCPACALVLTGPLAGRLWQVSVQASGLLRLRRELVTQLRADAVATPTAPHLTARPADPFSPAAPPTTPPPTPAAAPAAEWSRARVQNLLLALGVGLLAVAAVIFVAVSWDHLGVGGRSAVMAGVTALAAAGTAWTHRRGLVSTAEWLSALTVCLGLLDCYGARSSDLFGLGSTLGSTYWAGALAVVAALAGLLALVVPTRTLPLAAAVLGQLPVPFLVFRIGESGLAQPLAVSAALLAAQTVAVLGVAAFWPYLGSDLRGAREVRGAALAGGFLWYLAALLAAGLAAYLEDGSVPVGTALLVLLAAVPAAAATRLRARGADPELLPLLDGLAAAVLVAAVWAPVVDLVAVEWRPPTLAGAALVLLSAAAALPAARRTAPAVVTLAAAVAPLAAVTDDLEAVLERVVRPLDEPWALATGHAAAHLGAAALLTVAAAAAALAVGSLVLGQRWLRVAAVPAGAVTLSLVAPTAWAPYAVQVAALVVIAAGLLVAGAVLDGRGRVAEGWAALGSGALAALTAVTWSLATPTTTLWVLPAVACALPAGGVAARGNEALRAWRVVVVVGALVLGAAEAGAVARHQGAGWPAVWSVVLVLITLVAVGAAVLLSARTSADDDFWAPLHTAAVVVAAAAAVAATGALSAWQGVTVAGCGLATACAVAALLAGSAAPLPTRRPVRGAVQLTAAALAGPALALAAPDPDLLWLALLVVGVGTALVALTSTRHRLGWLAGALLTASSWVRLALADVTAPEAYTVPAGAALLVVGFLRRRRDPDCGSWAAYGAGLSLALVPSLLRAVTDAGDLRPLLLAVAATGVVAVGAVRRLQAPLLLGASVLAVDVAVQLAPYLVAAYEAVPRWVTIGSLGLALLVAGATYEQRVRDLRRVGRHVAGLG